MKLAFGMISLSALAFSASAGAVEVSCENEAGSCTVGDDGEDCSCLDGSSGMPDNAKPTGERSQEEMENECEELLVMVCGEKLPDPSEDCTADQLEICTAFLSTSYIMEEICYEDGDDEGTEDDDGDESGCSALPASKKTSYSLLSLVAILLN